MHDASAIDNDTRKKILAALATPTPGVLAKRLQRAEDRAHELRMLERLRVKYGHNAHEYAAAVKAWRALKPTRLFLEKAWKLWLAQRESDRLHDAIARAARADQAPRTIARDLGLPIRTVHYRLTLAREDQARAERGEETHRAQMLAERARQWQEIRAALAPKAGAP